MLRGGISIYFFGVRTQMLVIFAQLIVSVPTQFKYEAMI